MLAYSYSLEGGWWDFYYRDEDAFPGSEPFLFLARIMSAWTIKRGLGSLVHSLT